MTERAGLEQSTAARLKIIQGDKAETPAASASHTGCSIIFIPTEKEEDNT